MKYRYGIVTALTLDPKEMDYLLIEWPEDGTPGRMLGAYPSIEGAMAAAHAKLFERPKLAIEAN